MDDPQTPALAALRDADAALDYRVVRTALPDSPEQSAELQGIPVAALVRTIVVRRGADDYLFVLVPVGRRLDWPKLRAHLGVKRLSLPDADEALTATGYQRFTITPFGARRAWPVVADASIMAQPVVSIGGGVRGVNIHAAPAELVATLAAQVADVTTAQDHAHQP
jgi:Cys-tRNA(Pro)/Cys-tRNA(Cys) deacylase